MLEFLQTKQSHANFSTCAMETRNHLKNGVSPKNQKSRRNFLICGIVLSALFFTFSTTSVFSQAPPNDLCINAHQLDCNGYHDGTTVGTTCKGAPVNQQASCYGVWYKFEGDGNQTKITTSSTTGFLHKLVFYSGTCTGLSHIATINNGSNNTHTINIETGTTYYVYVAYFNTSGSATQTGTFTITRTCTSRPSNDLCINAFPLECDGYHDGTTAGSTCKGAPVNQEASCYGVWYKFEGDGSQMKITTSSTTGFLHKLVFYSGTCTGLSHIKTINNGSNNTHTINIETGTTYYVYVAYFSISGSITQTGSFTIQRTCATRPINDLCINATPLECGSTINGTTVGSTCKGAPVDQQASCYGVWYSFVGDGEQTKISTSSTTSFQHKLVLYSGTCTGLTHIKTINNGSNNSHSFTSISGTMYYVYIAYFSISGTITQTGNFTITKSSTCCTWPIGDPNYSSNVIAKLCDNTLTISGYGNMCDFWHSAEGEAPWWFNIAQRNAIHNIVIENGVLNIGERAFKDCSNLRKVTIPSSVIKINDQAFYGCCGLEEIICYPVNPPIVYENTFGGCGKSIPNCTVYVCTNCIEAYQKADYWKEFTNYQPLGVEETSLTQLQIFPNPANNEIFIQSELQIEKIEVYSLMGTLLVSENNFSGKISVSTLAQGIYLLKIYTDKGMTVRKFVKE